MRGNMLSVVRVLVLVLVALGSTACFEGVGPGYAGVKVNQYGAQRGVDKLALRTGRVWYNPFTETVYKFPTFQQNVVWVRGESADQSVTVNSREGAVLNFDVSAALAFRFDSVPAIFERFRKDEQHILEFFIRPMIRKAFSDRASTMPAVEFFGEGKRLVQDSVLAQVRAQLASVGIDVVSIEIMGEIRVDDTVKRSINAVLEASQRALEAQNKIVQSRAEAEQLVARARGDSTSAVIRASGQAQANALLQQSLTPALMQYRTIERWNGQLPQVQSGATPIVTLGTPRD